MMIKNLIKVLVQAIIGLCYCYFVSSKIPKGLSRLVSLLPIISLFIFLPLNLSSSSFLHLTFITAAYLVWLANFKLLLFAFDQGPLSTSSSSPSPSPTNNLLHFILIASLPIKAITIKNNNNNTYPSHQKPYHHYYLQKFCPKRVLFVGKVILLVIVLHVYQYKEYLHDHVVSSLYCCHLYLEVEIALAFFVAPARLLGFEVEPQFNEPYLATSLQDFWGRRWNVMVSSILRPTVYDPVKYVSTRVIGQRWAPLPGTIAVFTVSGLMHELIFYYVTRAPPTWEQLRFFLLHGVCLVVEVVVKNMVGNRWRLHGAVSGPLTVGFVGATTVWLYFPFLIRNNFIENSSSELLILIDFIKDTVIQILVFIRVF
ncbi:hypothetical protein ACOSQ4_030669 [Xanthoceras sorbifolium]